MTKDTRSCGTCTHQDTGGGLSSVKTLCWDCTSFKTLVHWEPKVTARRITVTPRPKELQLSLAEYVNTLTDDEPKSPQVDPKSTSVSDGSTADYYELPVGATELQDLISHKDMNAQIGEIFRESYRYGKASHCDELRGIKKIIFYAEAEKARLEKLIG